MHRSELRQRLHLAYHRQRQDAHLLQGLHAPQGQPRHREVPLRRRPQGPRPADPRGVQPLPGRLRRGEHQHRRTLVRRLLSDDYADKVIVMHHSEARPRPGRKQQAEQAEPEPGDWRPTRNTSNRCATSAWSSSSTNATARSSATITRPSRSSSPRPSYSASPARRSSRRTPRSRSIEGESGVLQDHARPLPEGTARLHHHPRHRGPQRPALPRRLLQARRHGRLKPGETLAKTGRRRCHPRQARRRHRRPQVQRPPRHRVHQRRHRVLRAVRRRAERPQARRPRLRPAQHRRRLLAARPR